MRGLKKILPGTICAILLALIFGGAMGEEFSDLCFQQRGTVKGAEPVSLFSEADKRSGVLAEISPGESGVILAEENGFYRILYRDQECYIPKEKVRLSAVQTSVPLPEAICKTISLEEPVPSRQDTHFKLQGTLTADQPLEAVFFFLWDDREFRVEYTYLLTLKEPSRNIDMSKYPRILPLKGLEGGRKTLVVEGVTGNELQVLFRSPAYVRGKSRDLPNVNSLCEGLPGDVLDTDVATAWEPTAKTPSLAFNVSPAAAAAIMVLEWQMIPDSCVVAERDSAGTLLKQTELKNHFYVDCVDLDPATHRIEIIPEGSNAALSSVRLYAEPWSRHVIQRWEPVPDKIDLLVISTHQDDEFLFLGGTIPCYAAREDVSVAVLYMVNCGRLRYGEALDALWSAGLKNHPLFLHLPDSYTHSIREARGLWNRHEPLEKLISIIRRYRPEVIVVQDFRGEYGNGEHKLTAELAAEAVEKAALSSEFPDSVQEYGPWQVKKLYSHLYQENQIQMDWNQPLDDQGVITPMFLAKEAFNRHLSQTALYTMESDGRRYDNSIFGLYYSAVGPDVAKNDFMENIQ